MGNISNAERARRAAALPESEQDAQSDEVEQVADPDAVVAEVAPEPAAAEVAAEPAPEPEPDLTGLIKVSKNGEVLHVHPCAMQQHKQLGWLVS